VTEAIVFLTAYVLTWQALIIAFVLGVILEHGGHRKSAVFAGLVVMAISYFYYSVSLKTIWYCVVGYVAIGLLWSFWRYKLYVARMVETLSQRLWKSQEEKEAAVKKLLPSNNLERITSWIIVWPFSLIEHTLGDIITMIQTLVTKFFKGVYHKIFVSQTAALLAREESAEPKA